MPIRCLHTTPGPRLPLSSDLIRLRYPNFSYPSVHLDGIECIPLCFPMSLRTSFLHILLTLSKPDALSIGGSNAWRISETLTIPVQCTLDDALLFGSSSCKMHPHTEA